MTDERVGEGAHAGGEFGDLVGGVAQADDQRHAGLPGDGILALDVLLWRVFGPELGVEHGAFAVLGHARLRHPRSNGTARRLSILPI